MTAKETIHSGWLTKSPPERKIHGPWRFFKSQWRRRYFVLSAVHASAVLPGSCPAHLIYYDNEKMAHRKGSINLDNCEQVVVHLESEYYKHVFIVRTTDHGHNRTYYLAADNEVDMERWVDQLCKLLGLHPDDESPAHSSRLTHSKSSVCAKNLPINPLPRRLTSPTVVSSISSSVLSHVSNDIDPFDSPSSVLKQPEDYLPLDQCNSGSVPPTPPRRATPSVKIIKIQTRREPSVPSSVFSTTSTRSDDTTNTEENDDNEPDDDAYNYPKNWYNDNRDSNVYKLPRSMNELQRDSTYDYPPTSSTSTSQEWKRDSTYDYPPNSVSVGGGDDNEDDTTYDYPPPKSPFVFRDDDDDNDDTNERPIWKSKSRPSQSSAGNAGDTYDIMTSIIQSNDGKSFKNGSLRGLNLKSRDLPPISDDTYDMPPSFNQVPPKGHLSGLRVHRYVNAPPVSISNPKPPVKHPSQGFISDDVYLAMTSIETRGDVYTTMDKMEPLEHDHENAMQLNEYQSEKRDSNVHSPSCRADVVIKLPKALPRTSIKQAAKDRGSENSNQLQFHVDSFKGNQRTRSFKRNISNTVYDDVPLPQKKTGTTDESSSSDDDDSEINSPTMDYINIHKVLESINETKGIQYLDLDLDTSSSSSSATNSIIVGPKSAIEYNEIDMEKTKALFDTKVTLEKSRTGSDRSEV